MTEGSPLEMKLGTTDVEIGPTQKRHEDETEKTNAKRRFGTVDTQIAS